METALIMFFHSTTTTFKSYYVVWKPDAPLLFVALTRTFKSYYVVWKQKIAQANMSWAKQFKSYYVVWKPRPDGFLTFPEHYV